MRKSPAKSPDFFFIYTLTVFTAFNYNYHENQKEFGVQGTEFPAGVQRQSLWQGDSPQCGEMSAKLTEGTAQLAWDSVPQSFKHSEKGEFLGISKEMLKKREKLCK